MFQIEKGKSSVEDEIYHRLLRRFLPLLFHHNRSVEFLVIYPCLHVFVFVQQFFQIFAKHLNLLQAFVKTHARHLSGNMFHKSGPKFSKAECFVLL